ncbi:leucyl aminopeptidase [Paenisporosarcina cavernae]|uniref:Probable cytosol aminopeptidase n=1 Tax=Paenisporosarcina cavernae TaxID=2320858 RepID=A0A385YTT3_9BACL|nr:leucyl aminopeptidase [Paenisporosarcina cavernae]AYC29954.1 leucyl aminopeptidase [Paenisporosarcina cavernae]
MSIEVKDLSFQEIQADLLVVGVYRNPENTTNWEIFSTNIDDNVSALVKNGFISTDEKKITKVPVVKEGTLQQVWYVGLGDRKQTNEDVLRAAFAKVGKELVSEKKSNMAIWLDSFQAVDVEVEDVAYLFTEGISLGRYTVPHYKTASTTADAYLDYVEVLTEADSQEITGYLEIGTIYGDATNEARSLVNMPSNILTATKMAEYAKELAEKYEFDYEELGKAEMEELGMGAILAVNKGSKEEPKMIIIKYRANEHWDDVVGLVGKGVTYDTGGYSIKPKDGLVGMKGDMGGAAAVLGAMQIIGETRPNKNVMAVIGATDNMISGDAFKPDDVIVSYSGKSIEVLNTDAEGRLVLADAVTYAKQQGANYIVDVATLTGGVIVALGMDKTGALTNNEEFFETFMEAALETGEFVWRLPLTESDKKRIRKSDVADLNNSPGRDGHMIFGGGFVGEFVENTPWIHLDIAGTSDASAAHDLGPKGGTGVMVRSLATLIERMAINEIEEK